jgi:hypothetical protein
MQDFCTDFCGKLPRELRDMVYHELLPEPSTHSSFSVDGIPRSWGVFGPAHLTKLGSDDSYTQIINEYTQVYYRDMCFRFYDGDIGLLPSFLDADPTESDIRPANLVRNIEIIVSKGVFIHLDTADQGESLPLDTYTMDISGKALCATLPELLRKINNQCRIVLRFEKDFHRVRKSPLRKVDHAHDLLKLFRSTRALLNRGPLAEIHFGQTKCSINPSASKPCEVFGQPVEEWAKVSQTNLQNEYTTILTDLFQEQQQLWEDLYKKVRLSKCRA